MQIHATAVEWHHKGILFLGKSGVGKSTAALLLMDQGAKLIADDQVILTIKKNKCVASCPPTIQNKMEVRGIGIIDIKAKKQTRIDLVVFLTKDNRRVVRMPQDSYWYFENIQIPSVTLCAFECAFCQRLKQKIWTLPSFFLPKKIICARDTTEKRQIK